MLITVLSVTSWKPDSSLLVTLALVSGTGWNQVPSCELMAPGRSWASYLTEGCSDTLIQSGWEVQVLVLLSSHHAKHVLTERLMYRLILTYQLYLWTPWTGEGAPWGWWLISITLICQTSLLLWNCWPVKGSGMSCSDLCSTQKHNWWTICWWKLFKLFREAEK